MDDTLFTLIGIMATVAFALFIIADFWPLILGGLLLGGLLYWLNHRGASS